MNSSNFKKSIAVFALVLFSGILLGTGNTKVEAASVSAISSLQQTAADKTSATISFQPSEDAASYNIFYKEYGADDFVLAGNTTSTTYTLTGLKPATNYSVKVTAVNGADESYGVTDYDVVTLPDQMTGLHQERWYYFIKELNVAWDRQSAADGYEVTLLDDKGKKVKSLTLSGYSSSISFSKMKDKVYTVKARSFMTYNGQKYYSSYASIRCLNQARITKIKVNGSKLKLKWGKISGATGYQIYVSTNPKKGYKKVATVSNKKNSCTIKKFKGKKFSSKKTYYVYVKTVCNKGKFKNTSGALYYWNSKTGNFGWL